METHGAVACPSCGHRNRSERRFCAQCGSRLGQPCPACGTLNELDEKFCGSCGAALVGAATDGERRQLTVLFCDLVGSTAIAGQLDPEDWREITARYQRAAAETVTKLGGHVAKYLGDGLLVYFGYPAAHEDDPERAVHAGLALIESVTALNRRLESTHQVQLAVRVGMHTGAVVVGEGATAGAEVFGDTPNVAARVQALAEPDTVLITAATHHLVAGRFIVEAKGAPPLKGVRTPLAVYRVVQASGVRNRLHAAGIRGLTPFVGRDAERRMLRERWAQTRAGQGQVVLISGEAGIGKSRLVQQFKEELGGEPHTWMECAGSPYHEHTPFHPVVGMLGQALAWRGDEPVEERIARLAQSLAAAGLEPTETVPLVAALLGLPLSDAYAPLPLNAEAQRRRLLATMEAWLFGLARRQPAIVVLEDLQWVDPSTLELQVMLVERNEGVPLLILYTARPEFRAPWPLLAHHAQLTLGRLGRQHVREIVTRVATRATLADLVEAVVTRTDGVPLFVEELTKVMLEAEVSGGPSMDAIPTTLQDSLMARLDRLGPAKDVAQLASVIGREFSYSLLQAVGGVGDGDLQSSLGRLVEAELVYARGTPPAASYVFKHALVREAAYGSLLKTRRRDLHRAIATALAEKFPEVTETQPELVAHHRTEAGDAELAAAAWQRAGERAAARSAHAEAIGHLRKGLEVLRTLTRTRDRAQQRFLMEVALCQALLATEGWASADFARLVDRKWGEDLDDVPELFYPLLGRWALCHGRGEVLAEQAIAAQLLRIAEKSSTPGSLVWAHFTRGSTSFSRGEFSDAREHFRLAIAAYDEGEHRAVVQDPGVLALSLGALASWQCGFADEARRRRDEALDLARRLGNVYDLASTHGNVGVLNIYLREPRRALEDAEHLVHLCTEHQFSSNLAFGLAERGWALAKLGRVEEGVAQLRQAIETALGAGVQGFYRLSIGLLATVLAEAGDIADANEALEDALRAAPGVEVESPEWLRVRGDLLIRQGAEPTAAEAAYREAIALARHQGARFYELRAATSFARLLRKQGRAAEAHAMLVPIHGWFTEGFDTHDVVEAQALLEELR